MSLQRREWDSKMLRIPTVVSTALSELDLPTAAKSVVELHKGQSFIELCLRQGDLSIEAACVAVQNFKVAGDAAVIANSCEPNGVFCRSRKQFLLRPEFLIFPVAYQRV